MEELSELWEILVPTRFGNGLPVWVEHHQEWDSYVRGLASGLTILHSAEGQWIDGEDFYQDTMIPVKISCDRDSIDKIIDFTIIHYQQIAVMAYKVSDEVIIRRKDELSD